MQNMCQTLRSTDEKNIHINRFLGGDYKVYYCLNCNAVGPKIDQDKFLLTISLHKMHAVI